jgi:CheY-like chemotaxis protein
LGVVAGLSRLALENCDSTTVREYLETIHHTSNDLLEWLTLAQDSACMAADGIQLKNQPFDVAELVEDLHALFAAKAHSCNLRFDCNAEITRTATPIGDRLRIKQVLVNLLTNAMKFTASGSISLNVKLELHGAERLTLVCEVRDTGVGLTRDAPEGTFQRSDQGHGNNLPPLESYGLGLPLCQDLLHMMGSSLEFESECGQGTLFHFAVELDAMPGNAPIPRRPCLPSHAGALSADVKRATPALNRLRVLIADDNPLDQCILQEYLGMVGAAVTLASNGKEVLQQLQRQQFDALLLDTRMPQMGGVEVAQRIAALPGIAHLQVVAITADADPLVQYAYHAARVAAVLIKPVDPLTLMQILANGVQPSSTTAGDRHNSSDWNLENLRLQVGFKEGTVQNLLRIFQRQALNNFHALTELIRRGRPDDAMEVLHTISGAAATIGAQVLHTVSAQLLGSLQNGYAQGATLQQFSQAFDRAMASMPLTNRAPIDPTTADKLELQHDLQALDIALGEQLFIPSETLEKIRRNLSPEQTSNFELMCAYTQELDYPQARHMARALCA